MNPYDPPLECPIDVPKRTNTRELETRRLRGLRTASHIIRFMGVLSCVSAFFGPIILSNLLPDVILEELSRHPQIITQCVTMGSPVFFGVVTYGCLKRPSWGRFTGVLFSGFLTCLIPFGTVFGLIGPFTLAGNQELFDSEKYIHEDLDLEWELRKNKK